MNSHHLRALTEADVSDFWELRLRALKLEPESFGSAYEECADDPIAVVGKRLQSSNDSFVMGAFDPKLIGMVGFYRRSGLKMRHKGNIWGMYVAPEHRRKGLGRALMLAVVSRVVSLPGLEELLLTVVTSKESARSLYLSLGFKSYGIERNALHIGDKYFDEELMALTLATVRDGTASDDR